MPSVDFSAPRSSSPKVWVAWCAGLLVCATTVTVLYVFVGVKAAWSDYTTILIAVLFLITLRMSFQDASALARQTHLADLQVESLRRGDSVARFVETAQLSAFSEHIRDLWVICNTHVEIQQDALIEVLHSRLLARNRLVDLLANTLITLGLIGTIVGLLQAVDGLGGLLGSNETGMEAIKQGMQATIAGLGTAFYTTLFGALFGGVILRILNSVVEQQVETFVAHIARLSEVHVLPVLRAAAAKRQSAVVRSSTSP